MGVNITMDKKHIFYNEYELMPSGKKVQGTKPHFL